VSGKSQEFKSLMDIKFVSVDGGGEYIINAFQSFLIS
jgi:hypothetical protein